MADPAEGTNDGNEFNSPGTLLSDKFYGEGEDDATNQDGTPGDDAADDDAGQVDDAGADDDDADAVDDDDDAAGDEGDDADSDDDSDDDDDSEVIGSIDELAEHLKTDREYIESLKTTQKVNGRDVEMTVGEAFATARKVASGDDYLAAAKVKSKEIVQGVATQQEEWATNVSVSQKLIADMEADYNREMTNTNWDKLREDDPAEHFAKRQEMKERKEKLDGYKSGIKQQIEAAKSTAQQTAEAERAQSVPEQRQLLAELLPEWKDAKVFAKEKQEIVPYLTDKGFSVEDIREAAHQAPVLALAVKAMRYDRSKRKAAKAKKKVTKAPKMLRPGSDQSATKPKSGKDEKDPVKIMYG